MNARGTRRPHQRRVRSKPMTRKTKSGGGGSDKDKGCALEMIALLAFLVVVPAAVWAAVAR